MKYKIWLLMLNIKNAEKKFLVDKYKKEEIIYDKFEDIVNCNEIIIKKIKKISKENLLQKAVEIVEWMRENNVGFLSVNDKEYPHDLRVIEDLPYGFFYKGNKELLASRKVSIIGSRACSNYGSEVTKLLTKDLIRYNITILSGGAKGIDTISHKTTVEGNGKTIVVLGCGIDIAYPAQNYKLFKEIEKTGLIISEFLPGTPPLPYNFPQRNRIISALSELVIVVEASNKSGSLITVNYALDQGKCVMAIPGSIFSKGSLGTNQLLREGAQVFTGLEDLHQLLKLDKKKDINELSPIEKNVLSVVSDIPIHIDNIMKKTNLSREVLFKLLFKMQVSNKIISLPGDYYAKIN